MSKDWTWWDGPWWTKITEDPIFWVLISYPCEVRYGSRHWLFECQASDREHGHLVMQCEDGCTVVPACIYSLEFLEAIVVHLLEKHTSFTVEEISGILTMAVAKNSLLHQRMTPQEREIVNSGKLDVATDFNWHG